MRGYGGMDSSFEFKNDLGEKGCSMEYNSTAIAMDYCIKRGIPARFYKDRMVINNRNVLQPLRFIKAKDVTRKIDEICVYDHTTKKFVGLKSRI